MPFALAFPNWMIWAAVFAAGLAAYMWHELYGPRRITKRLNTVNLGDGDDLDMLEDIEETFDVVFGDGDLDRCETVGQLMDLIQAKGSTALAPEEHWSLLCAIVRNHSCTADPIDRNTTFYAHTAKKRHEANKPNRCIGGKPSP